MTSTNCCTLSQYQTLQIDRFPKLPSPNIGIRSDFQTCTYIYLDSDKFQAWSKSSTLKEALLPLDDKLRHSRMSVEAVSEISLNFALTSSIVKRIALLLAFVFLAKSSSFEYSLCSSSVWSS